MLAIQMRSRKHAMFAVNKPKVMKMLIKMLIKKPPTVKSLKMPLISINAYIEVRVNLSVCGNHDG